MNVSAAILVTGTSSGVHHDHYNSFGLLQLPSDTCFRLRAIFLATRFLKSFSLCCFCTEVIHFSHHNFWEYVVEKKYCVICSHYSFPCLKKMYPREKNDNTTEVVKMGIYDLWQGFVRSWLLWTSPAMLAKDLQAERPTLPSSKSMNFLNAPQRISGAGHPLADRVLDFLEHYVSDIVWNESSVLIYLIIITTLWGWYYHFHCTYKETEVQRGHLATEWESTNGKLWSCVLPVQGFFIAAVPKVMAMLNLGAIKNNQSNIRSSRPTSRWIPIFDYFPESCKDKNSSSRGTISRHLLNTSLYGVTYHIKAFHALHQFSSSTQWACAELPWAAASLTSKHFRSSVTYIGVLCCWAIIPVHCFNWS